MIFLCLLLIIFAVVLFTINDRAFGKLPRHARKKKITLQVNYKDHELQNLVETPMRVEGVGFGKILFRFLFSKNPNSIPLKPLPSLIPKIDQLPTSSSPEIIWFGHSSYLIKIDGKRILVDPVFSGRASPFTFMGPKAFKGTEVVKAEEIKNIDVLLITHDHYDHLDYETIVHIHSNVAKVVASLGVGAHLERWGVPSEKIIELAWEESIQLNGLEFTSVPARHFSGRKFEKNQTLWSAFILKTNTHKLFFGGDSGYEQHFKNIGEKYGPFDFALLECGQYNNYWPFIHMFPEQTVQASIDLQAKVLMPVHWGKFSLAMHPWDEPIKRFILEAEKRHLVIVTPRIGEAFSIDGPLPTEHWWELN